MARDERLIVRFQAEYYDPDAKLRVWNELVDYATDYLEADSFSSQTNLLHEDIPPEAAQARESILNHTRMQRARRRSFIGLRAPTWLLEPPTKKWFRDAGPWIYRSTLWRGKGWVLESQLWGKYFNLVVRPDEWSHLQTEKPWLATLEPPPKAEPLRKEDESIRRGWSLSRPTRALSALAAAVAVAALWRSERGFQWILWAILYGILAYRFLPARDPVPTDRLIARARLPIDPGFERRFGRTAGLGVIGALVAWAAISLVATSDAGSGWRLALWSLAVVGGVLALYSAGLTTWWLFKYRRKEPP